MQISLDTLVSGYSQRFTDTGTTEGCLRIDISQKEVCKSKFHNKK